MQMLPEQFDQQGHHGKHHRGQHQEYDAFQVIRQMMEPVQTIQPFQGLKKRVITFPQRKVIIETNGWTHCRQSRWKAQKQKQTLKFKKTVSQNGHE